MENLSGCSCHRLSACALSGAAGITSALAVGILGILAKTFHFGVAWVSLISSVYIGYAATPKGIVIGMGWAFADAFILGFVFTCIYNFIAKKCPCKSCRSGEIKPS